MKDRAGTPISSGGFIVQKPQRVSILQEKVAAASGRLTDWAREHSGNLMSRPPDMSMDPRSHPETTMHLNAIKFGGTHYGFPTGYQPMPLMFKKKTIPTSTTMKWREPLPQVTPEGHMAWILVGK